MNALPTKFRQSLRRSKAAAHVSPELDLVDEDVKKKLKSFQKNVNTFMFQRLEWEKRRLDQRVNFDFIQIDPAPF